MIVLPGGGSTALHLNQDKARYAIRYLNLGSCEWLNTKTQKMTMGGTTQISAPDNNEWLIVVTKGVN